MDITKQTNKISILLGIKNGYLAVALWSAHNKNEKGKYMTSLFKPEQIINISFGFN